MRSKIKELSKNKSYVYALLVFGILVLIVGIKSAYAYYHDEKSFSILSALVGDFDGGDGDINIIIYKQLVKKDTDEDENSKSTNYAKSYSVPEMGYKFNDQLTECNFEGNNESVQPEAGKACTKGSGSTTGCYYDYSEADRKFSVTSDRKVTCKFYFDKTEESDINVYLYAQKDGGEKQYNNKSYSLVNGFPAFGYEYKENGDGDTAKNYECYDISEDGSDGTKNTDATVKFENGKFTVETQKRTNCYIYLDSTSSADIIANIYLRNGENSYRQVKTIPTIREYTLSNGKSKCYKYGTNGEYSEEVADNGTNITYNKDEGVKIDNISEKVKCDVYLEEKGKNYATAMSEEDLQIIEAAANGYDTPSIGD